MEKKIGVIGSGVKGGPSELVYKARSIGREIAACNDYLITGAGLGLPYEAVIGAKEMHGFTVGVSPAHNLKEHMEKYLFPAEHFDLLVYTGAGLKGRNVIMVRTCDAVVSISGRIGTLNELTIAYDEGKPIGLLRQTGGVSDEFEQLAERLGKMGGKIISDENPKSIIKRLTEIL